MDSAEYRARLANDPEREAVDSLAGYVYQIWQSLLAWIDLRPEETLFLEGAEDADVLRPGGATTTQIRRVSGSVTLNNEGVREAIGHFWEHRARNPDLTIKYRYLTTAAVAQERPDRMGFGRPGLELWREAQVLQDEQQWRPIVEALRQHLLQDEHISTAVKDFLRSAEVNEVREQLILPISWDVGAQDQAELRLAVERAVVAYGRARNYTAPHARMAIPALLQRALEAATSARNRWLDSGDLADVFETATSVPVPINVLQQQSAPAVVEESPLDPLPVLPPRFYHRPEICTNIANRLTASALVVISGSSGVGKTAVAVDVANRSNRVWAHLELRDHTPQEVEHKLRLALRTIPEAQDISILIDDLPTQSDVRRFERTLGRLIDLITSNNGQVIITSYQPLPPSLMSAARITTNNSYQLPMFEEGDVRGFLVARGVDAEDATRWARIIIATTGGHPTLVDARVQALESRGFPRPRVEDVFDQPAEVLDVGAEVRTIISQLAEPEKNLLYRASLTTHPLRREHLVALGTETIQDEQRIAHPGESLDRLIGPWLEVTSQSRYRVSPLVFNVGALTHGEQWLRAAHRALGRALLVVRPVDVRDAVSVVLHAASAEDGDTLIAVLASFLQTGDESFWVALVSEASWFTRLAIGTPPHASLDNPLTTFLLRSAQYRASRAANDAEAAGAIVDAFESAVPDDAFHAPLRFMFYATACVYSAEPAERHLHRALSWVAVSDRLPELSGPVVDQMRDVLQDMPQFSGDLANEAGVFVFGGIETVADFDAVVRALSLESDALIRRFVASLEAAPVLWRSVVAKLILDERDSEAPNYQNVARAIQTFSELCVRAGAHALALEAISSAIRVLAEFAEDVSAAEEMLSEARERYGNVPRLLLSEAAINHARGEQEAALLMFQSAIAGIEYSEDDIEPALDLRMAAIDAANLSDFVLAADLLELGASHATLENTPWVRLGLLFDAAYASWRAGQERRSLRLAETAADELLTLDARGEEPAYRNLTRRFGHVVLQMALSPATNAPSSTIGFVGYVSELDDIGDTATTPVEMIGVVVAQFESRISDDPSWFYRHRERLISSEHPMRGMALHVGMRWSIRHGEPDLLLADASQFYTEVRDVASGRGQPVSSEDPPYIHLVGAALLAIVGRGRFSRDALASALAEAQRLNLTSVADWLRDSMHYLENRDDGLAALRGSYGDYRTQFGAAVVLSADPTLAPAMLVRAYEIWIGHLSVGAEEYPVAAALLSAMRETLRHCIIEQRVNLRTPLYTVPRIVEAIQDTSGTEWQQIARLIRSAAEAASVQLWESTRTALTSRGATI